MNVLTTLALCTAAASAALACGRRWVWALGAYGPTLAPPFLLIVWFAALSVGQYTGSLTGAGWVAAVPLALIAWLAVARDRRPGRSPFRWTAVDRSAFAFLALFLVAYCGNDTFCHYSVVGAYLRDNIPPCAQNDPGRPLRYHGVFDAAAALVTDSTGATPETALDVVSIVCVFASMCGLQALSRVVFEGRRARQCARLFYLLGFGPVFLNHLRLIVTSLAGGSAFRPGSSLFHGHTAQSFVEVVPRRPMGLNHVLFVFFLASALPRLPSSARPGVGPSRAPHPAWWLPCAFLLPQASEDLTGLCGLVVLWLWVSGALGLRWVVAWGVATLAALPMSGVVASMLSPQAQAASPRIALGWPPSLPYWVDLETPAGLSKEAGWALIREGMPLSSGGSAWVGLTEWGPLFLGALLLAVRDARRRVVVAVFVVGLLLASGLGLRGWYKADLDRFLFYGTSAGFLLTAVWVEMLEKAWKRGEISRPWFRVAATVLVILPTTLGPIGFAARYSAYWLLVRNSRSPIAFSDAELFRLRRALAAVGPRETVLTDVRYAQTLLLAGFVVDAPLAPGFSIGIVDEGRLASYRPDHPGTVPAWSFLPADDPRIAGRPVIAEYQGYRLVRSDTRRAPRGSSPGP